MSRRNRSELNVNKIRLNKNKLVKWRFGQLLSQRKAAKQLHIAEATYRKAEAGGIVQGLIGAKISKHIGIPLDQLLELK